MAKVSEMYVRHRVTALIGSYICQFLLYLLCYPQNRGLRISRSKTEYLVPSHQRGVVKLEGEPLPSVNSFKYLGSVIAGSGGCGKDVDGRIKVAWSRWRDLSGVIYDKKVPMKLKSKMYKTVVRPAMIYGSECWALRKQEE